jgi:hypothetical protein
VKVSPACGKKSSGRVTSAGRALRLPETLEYLARQVARDCMDEARAVRVRKHWRERRPAIRCCHLRPGTGLRSTLRSCAAVALRRVLAAFDAATCLGRTTAQSARMCTGVRASVSAFVLAHLCAHAHTPTHISTHARTHARCEHTYVCTLTLKHACMQGARATGGRAHTREPTRQVHRRRLVFSELVRGCVSQPRPSARQYLHGMQKKGARVYRHARNYYILD